MNNNVISRQAAIDACNQSINILEATERIKDLPSVTPKQRTGHWIKTKEERGGISEIWYNCSECGWRNSLYLPRSFCPNCGADMREPKESENVANVHVRCKSLPVEL